MLEPVRQACACLLSTEAFSHCVSVGHQADGGVDLLVSQSEMTSLLSLTAPQSGQGMQLQVLAVPEAWKPNAVPTLSQVVDLSLNISDYT